MSVNSSINRRGLAAVVTLTLAVGAAAAGTFTAGNAAAATRPCGPRCIDIFSRASGTHGHPGLVLDVPGHRPGTGQPIAGFRASRLDPGQDFTVSFRGRVSGFYSAGVVTAWLAKRYGGQSCLIRRPGTGRCLKRSPDDYAYEIEYAPRGVGSGLCVGTAVTAVNGTPVSLQPCGVSGRTVWVVDAANSTDRFLFRRYAPLINGSETGFTRPYVLTCPRGPGPAHRLTTQTLGQSGPGSQQWGADTGMLR